MIIYPDMPKVNSMQSKTKGNKSWLNNLIFLQVDIINNNCRELLKPGQYPKLLIFISNSAYAEKFIDSKI